MILLDILDEIKKNKQLKEIEIERLRDVFHENQNRILTKYDGPESVQLLINNDSRKKIRLICNIDDIYISGDSSFLKKSDDFILSIEVGYDKKLIGLTRDELKVIVENIEKIVKNCGVNNENLEALT
jgi:hypothetical protein